MSFVKQKKQNPRGRQKPKTKITITITVTNSNGTKHKRNQYITAVHHTKFSAPLFFVHKKKLY